MTALEVLRRWREPLTVMEVCGTHTAAIAKSGIRSLLPENIRLVSGPGCPVCVTEAGFIDGLIREGRQPDTVVLSFGDLLKVRGSEQSLAEGLRNGVRVVYNPLEAAALARDNPGTRYVLAAVGFETTIPLYALLLDTIRREKLDNLFLMPALKTMIPAMAYICEQEAINAFLCPGHVSVIIGSRAFEPLCARYRKPFVVAGFAPEQILAALAEMCVQTQRGEYTVANLYSTVVKPEGNPKALAKMDEYFLPYESGQSEVAQGCRCADVLLGRIPPADCPLFGRVCTPANPVGACMTSQEGACGVWYQYV